jgi:hypothetical protein
MKSRSRSAFHRRSVHRRGTGTELDGNRVRRHSNRIANVPHQQRDRAGGALLAGTQLNTGLHVGTEARGDDLQAVDVRRRVGQEKKPSVLSRRKSSLNLDAHPYIFVTPRNQYHRRVCTGKPILRMEVIHRSLTR